MNRSLNAAARWSLLLLSQLRDRAWMILLISIGTGLLTQAIREGIGWTSTHLEWGMGMVVFGGLTLMVRSKVEGSK